LEAGKTVLASGHDPRYLLCIQTARAGDEPVRIPTDDAADSIRLLSGYAARIQLVCWIEIHFGGIP
ncbi:MAG: hypothetical protein NTW33_00360, partial [Methanoregula sp.]|nr:hypothetical protein [Methanoregula sp.]